MTLPLSPRRLWLVRVASLTVSLVVPVALFLLPLAWRDSSTGLGFHAGVLSLIPRLSLALVVMLLLLHVPAPQLHRLRGWEYVAWVVAIAIVLMMLTLALPHVWWLLAIVAVGVVALGARLAGALPKAFAFHPHDPEEVFEPATRIHEEPAAASSATEIAAQGTATEAATDRGTRTSMLARIQGSNAWLLHVTLGRTLNNHFLGWLNVFLIFLYSAILVIDFATGMTPLPRLVLAYIWVQAFFAQGLARLHKLDPWPVSRRLLFAHAMLPAVVAGLLGVGVGSLVTAVRVPALAQVRYEDQQIQVPVDVHEIARDGRTPTVTAPWGESHTPRAYRILQGVQAVTYNPFEHGEDSTPRFIAWQLDRAVAAVHGSAGSGGPESWSPGSTSSRQNQEGNDLPPELATRLEPGIEAGTLRVLGSVGRGSDLRSRTLALSVLALSVIVTIFVAIGLQQHRAGPYRRAYGWAAVGLVLLGVFAVLGTLLAERWSFTDAAWALGAVPVIRLRELATSLTLPTSGLWLAAAASLAVAYLIVQERFARIEAPTKPVKSEFSKDY
jgi:hypothetical protein